LQAPEPCSNFENSVGNSSLEELGFRLFFRVDEEGVNRDFRRVPPGPAGPSKALQNQRATVGTKMPAAERGKTIKGTVLYCLLKL